MIRPGWLRSAAFGFLLAGALTPVRASSPHTNPLNFDPLVKDAFAHFYLLDYPGAVERFEHFHALHPGDPYGTALLLDAVVFQELYRLDLLDTTFYANDGFLTGHHATEEDPKARDHIFALADETVREADWRIGKDPGDLDAYYARGWARSLKCAYIAMVERGFGAAFRLAAKAKDDHLHILKIDPDYTDAKLVPGVYEYVIGALPGPFKFFIGFAGISGSKTKGLQLLNDSAAHGTATNIEARTVIALFLRREARYKEAIQVVRTLTSLYPQDFLFCLEEANLRKDAGEGMAAVDAYREIISHANTAGYFASARMELADFGLGDALRGQRLYHDAALAYARSAGVTGVGLELKIRSLLAAGQCHDLSGERDQAIKAYQGAIDAGPSTSRADAARKYLRNPYKGS